MAAIILYFFSNLKRPYVTHKQRIHLQTKYLTWPEVLNLIDQHVWSLNTYHVSSDFGFLFILFLLSACLSCVELILSNVKSHIRQFFSQITDICSHCKCLIYRLQCRFTSVCLYIFTITPTYILSPSISLFIHLCL